MPRRAPCWRPAWPPNAPLGNAVDALDAVARASAIVPRSSLPSDVILGQLRSTVVDLFQVAGLDVDEFPGPDAAPQGSIPLADAPPD